MEMNNRFVMEDVSMQGSSADPFRSKTQWMAIKDIEATKSDILKHRQLHERLLIGAQKTKEEYDGVGRNYNAQDDIVNSSQGELRSLANLAPM